MKALMAALLAVPVLAAAQPAPPLIDQPVPQDSNLVVRMLTVDIPPAGAGPTDTRANPGHRHPGATYAYVLQGHVRSRLGDGPEVLYGPGQAWSETPNQPHYIVNASATEPARLLVTFIVRKDDHQMTEPLPQ